MSQVSKTLTDELITKAKTRLKKIDKHGRVGTKLQMIIAAKKHGITNVCRINGLSRTTLTDWIRKFNQDDMHALANKPKKPKSPLNQHIETLKKWIVENSNITAKELVIKIEDQLNIKTSKSSVYRLLKRLKFSYITPRPRHFKQERNSHEEFKKKSSSEN